MAEEETMDHYEVLGISYDATEEAIKRSYHRLARQYHPDRCHAKVQIDTDKFNRIQMAWKVLGDPASRAAYNNEIHTSIQSYMNMLRSAENVEFSEFEKCGDIWQRPCRCGDYFQVRVCI